MKITKNVNIAGVVYIMDEDAFDLLSSYLNDISSRIDNQSDKTNILSDIESRVSEIFTNQGIGGYKVVSINSVRSCISIIGEPTMFGSRKYDPNSYSNQTNPITRKLLRDIDDRVLGGVCSGLAAYLNCDTAIIRITIFFLFLIGGCGLILYIAAWIIIPAARTEKDKELLRLMRER